MKNILYILTAIVLMGACKDVAVPPTQTCETDFADSSSKHPKAAVYQSIVNKYVKKGMPGIVLYIRDSSGVWIGSAGKADIDKNINMAPCPIFPIVTGHFLRNKFKAKKLIFEIRDLWPLTPMYLAGYKKSHPFIMFLAWIEKFGYKKSDYIVSLLPNADKYIDKISGKPEKFRYIPNGLSEDQLVDEPLPADVEAKLPKDKFVIGYTGTIGLANALEFFVDAAGLLKDNKDLHFVVVGDGYLKDQLVETSKDFGNITFISKIKKNQVQNMLKHFDVCFVGRNNTPLFEHGVSANKFFDYMLAEKPILDSNNLIKDPVEMSGCGIIVTPDSAETIKDGVLQLYNMTTEQRTEMGKKGSEYVKKFHSIKNLSDLYMKLFR
jgi:glycosyltransferase involved in cell wall biosynthesis